MKKPRNVSWPLPYTAKGLKICNPGVLKNCLPVQFPSVTHVLSFHFVWTQKQTTAHIDQIATYMKTTSRIIQGILTAATLFSMVSCPAPQNSNDDGESRFYATLKLSELYHERLKRIESETTSYDRIMNYKEINKRARQEIDRENPELVEQARREKGREALKQQQARPPATPKIPRC